MADAIPDWGTDDLPEPKPLRWRNWTSFIGPGIVMMGIQIGGGEWLVDPKEWLAPGDSPAATNAAAPESPATESPGIIADPTDITLPREGEAAAEPSPPCF